MDQNSNKTKNWLRRLRYLKMFRNSPSSSDSNAVSSQDHQSESLHSLSSNSLDETSQIRRNGSSFRRSLRKWQTRMKNCFSKSSKHGAQRINITQAPPSPTISRRSYSSPPQKENLHQRNSQSFIAEQTVSNCSSVDYAPRNNSLSHCVWYWGHVSKPEVIARLDGAPDGSFLVRDSESDRHVFSISFRSFGLTLHSRIEYTNNGYNLFEQEGYSSVKELIEKAIEVSKKDILCYTKSSSEEPNFPVMLLKPISRYDEVQSLQSLARFIIRQHVNLNDLEKLCLPQTLISYLKEKNYFR